MRGTLTARLWLVCTGCMVLAVLGEWRPQDIKYVHVGALPPHQYMQKCSTLVEKVECTRTGLTRRDISLLQPLGRWF